VKEELPKTAGYCKDAIGTLKAFDTYFVGPEDARSAREERITAMITDLDALIEGGDEEARAVKSVHYTAFLMDILANWRDRLILRDKLPAFSEALRNLDGQVQAELEKIESEIDSLKKLAGIADIVGLILKQILPAPGIH